MSPIQRVRYANFALPFLLALATAGCQQPADGNVAIDNVAELNEFTTLPADDAADDSAAGIETLANAAAPAATRIPAQYRGRWGMVAADCTSTRGDAKGLIDIGDTSIKYYESRATLKEQRPAIATSFSGLFSFTGEGQTWEKVVTLTRTGDTLKRADDEGSYDYKRCA